MKVLFLNTPYKFKISRDSRWPEYTKSGTLYYPYWLSYAAGVMMEKSDHEVLLLDAIAKEWSFKETLKKLKSFSPNLIVMSTNTPTITSDVKFAEMIKEEIPDVRIVFVGTHVGALPTETLRMSEAVDFVARKEYDYTILDLANTLESDGNLSKILGVSYRKGKKVKHNKDRPLIQNLDEIPFVSKVYKKFLDVHDYRYALARWPMVQIWSSRGCPNMCSFCQYPQVFSGRTFRVRTPKNFVDELEWIKEHLKSVKEIFVEDDTMSIDKKRMLEIARLIKERDLDITWSFNGRADIPYEVLKAIKEAGCRMIIVGYESGSQRILNKVIKKGIYIPQAIRFTLNAKRIGIKLFGCFMLGFPEETEEDVMKTFEYAKKLNPDMVFFQQAVPFPGTELYEWVKSAGYLKAKSWDDWLDENGRLSFLIDTPELSAKRIRELREKLTLKFYLNPKWIAQAILHNLHPDEMIRLTKAAGDYLKFLILKR